MNDLVSVVMPIYNSEKYLGQAIDSVLSQSHRNWELHLVDDCSADSSPEIVKAYSRKDSRILPGSTGVNSGAAVARNIGIEQAKGRYLSFLDSDDVWDSAFLEHQLQFMKLRNARVVFCSYKRMDESLTREVKRIFVAPDLVTYKDTLKTCSLNALTTVIDTNGLGVIRMPERAALREDFAYFLSLLREVGCAYGNKEVLAAYRMRDGSISSNKRRIMKYQWNVYRRIENIGVAKSLYLLGCWMLHGVGKYIV
jgi:teichuronic acid biosynthesis glycosyltransferase TuaG